MNHRHLRNKLLRKILSILSLLTLNSAIAEAKIPLSHGKEKQHVTKHSNVGVRKNAPPRKGSHLNATRGRAAQRSAGSPKGKAQAIRGKNAQHSAGSPRGKAQATRGKNAQRSAGSPRGKAQATRGKNAQHAKVSAIKNPNSAAKDSALKAAQQRAIKEEANRKAAEAERLKRERAAVTRRDAEERRIRDEAARVERERAEAARREEEHRREETVRHEAEERHAREEAARVERERAEAARREETVRREAEERHAREEAVRLERERAETARREETTRREEATRREAEERRIRDEAARVERERVERAHLDTFWHAFSASKFKITKENIGHKIREKNTELAAEEKKKNKDKNPVIIAKLNAQIGQLKRLQNETFERGQSPAFLCSIYERTDNELTAAKASPPRSSSGRTTPSVISSSSTGGTATSGTGTRTPSISSATAPTAGVSETYKDIITNSGYGINAVIETLREMVKNEKKTVEVLLREHSTSIEFGKLYDDLGDHGRLWLSREVEKKSSASTSSSRTSSAPKVEEKKTPIPSSSPPVPFNNDLTEQNRRKITVNFNGKNIDLLEYTTLANGDCGLSAIGISRENALALVNDPQALSKLPSHPDANASYLLPEAQANLAIPEESLSPGTLTIAGYLHNPPYNIHVWQQNATSGDYERVNGNPIIWKKPGAPNKHVLFDAVGHFSIVVPQDDFEARTKARKKEDKLPAVKKAIEEYWDANDGSAAKKLKKKMMKSSMKGLFEED